MKSEKHGSHTSVVVTAAAMLTLAIAAILNTDLMLKC